MGDAFLNLIPTRCPHCDKLEPCEQKFCMDRNEKQLDPSWTPAKGYSHAERLMQS